MTVKNHDFNGVTFERNLNHTYKTELETGGTVADLVSLISEYFPKLIEASKHSILLDGDVLVGETIDRINVGLGGLQELNARGV